MAPPDFPTVDVREMLCAQALSAAARAMMKQKPGEALEVLYGADDVKSDLLIWAQGLGHRVKEVRSGVLRIEKSGSIQTEP